jgi:hypothetical protein
MIRTFKDPKEYINGNIANGFIQSNKFYDKIFWLSLYSSTLRKLNSKIGIYEKQTKLYPLKVFKKETK